MIKYCFYTEYDKLNVQTANEAFGPAGTYTPGAGPTQDQFRITNLHTSSEATALRAFAMTTGTIAAQFENSDSSSNTLNLILKPTLQPPFSYAPIRYIIYKGILKSSLLGLAPNYEILNSTELGQFLIDEQDRNNQAIIAAGGTATGPADYRILGLHLTPTATMLGDFADSDPIDNLFYRNNPDFTLVTIDEPGMFLGNFDNSKFGIEIVLDSALYDAPLEITRHVENYIRQDQLSGSPTLSDTINNRIKREEVLRYGDPCSLLGAYFKDHKFLAKTVDSGSNVVEEKISGNEVYDKILQGTQHTSPTTGTDVGTFYNRSRIMLDIRNEFNFSYNFFNHYTDNFKLSYNGGDTYSVENYYTSTWPYYFIDNLSLPTGNSSNDAEVTLRLSKSDNSKPLIYFSQGYTKNFRELKGKRKFEEVFNKNDDPVFSDAFDFIVPNYDNGGDTRVVSSHVKLRYLWLYDEEASSPPTTTGTALRASHPYDHMFLPFSMKPVYKTDDDLQSRLYEEEFFVDQILEKGLAYVAATGISRDAHNVTFYAYATERYKKKLKFNRGYSIIGQSTNAAETFDRWLYQTYPQTGFSELTVTTDAGTVKRLSNKPEFGMRTLIEPDTDELIVLNIFTVSFQDIENLVLAAAMPFLPGFPVYFGFTNKTPKTAPAPDLTPYTEYDLVVRGFVNDSGTIRINELNTNKKIYT